MVIFENQNFSYNKKQEAISQVEIASLVKRIFIILFAFKLEDLLDSVKC